MSSELSRPLLGKEHPRGSKYPKALVKAIFSSNLRRVNYKDKRNKEITLSNKRKISYIKRLLNINKLKLI